jgi:hypothetical protein
MQNGKVLSLISLLLLLAALAACRSLPRLDTGLRQLPVDRLPHAFAGWTSGPDIAADNDVQTRLPTARILERNYVNATGKIANLMLVTATDDEDFHKPTACLPAQGWTLRDQTDMPIGQNPVRAVVARRDRDGFIILYYWVRIKTAPPPRHSLLATTLQLRKYVAHEDLSLFVRVAMPDNQMDRPDLMQFMTALWTELQPILGGNAEVVLRS